MVTAWLRDAWAFSKTRRGLAAWGGGLLVVVLVAYVLLARSSPGVGLLATSILTFVAVLLGTFAAWPAERKITLQRQAEVLAYRVAVALGAYLLIGLALLWLVNQVSGYVVPLAWPDELLTRVPFWPFYVLLTVGCSFLLPTPPDAC